MKQLSKCLLAFIVLFMVTIKFVNSQELTTVNDSTVAEIRLSINDNLKDSAIVNTSSLYLTNTVSSAGQSSFNYFVRLYGTSLKKKGVDYATLKLNHDTSTYYLTEEGINSLGLDLLQANFEGHEKLALEVLKINTLLFSNSLKTYQTYEKALKKAGKKSEL